MSTDAKRRIPATTGVSTATTAHPRDNGEGSTTMDDEKFTSFTPPDEERKNDDDYEKEEKPKEEEDKRPRGWTKQR